MIGYPIDEISPNYDVNRYHGIKHEHMSFPGDQDNVSLYYGGNHKDELVSSFKGTYFDRQKIWRCTLNLILVFNFLQQANWKYPPKRSFPWKF